MINLIYKLIGSVIYLLIVAVFIYLGVSAWQYDLDMIGAICFSIAISGLVLPLVEYIKKVKEKRQQTLRKIYNIPLTLNNEYGEVWDKEFQKVITKAIETTTDSAKLSDFWRDRKANRQVVETVCRPKTEHYGWALGKKD